METRGGQTVKLLSVFRKLGFGHDLWVYSQVTENHCAGLFVSMFVFVIQLRRLLVVQSGPQADPT